MLILSRCPQESIMIGDDVKLKVLAIKGKQVRFGIEADKNIPIYREEIWRQIHQESQEKLAANLKQNETSKNKQEEE